MTSYFFWDLHLLLGLDSLLLDLYWICYILSFTCMLVNRVNFAFSDIIHLIVLLWCFIPDLCSIPEECLNTDDGKLPRPICLGLMTIIESFYKAVLYLAHVINVFYLLCSEMDMWEGVYPRWTEWYIFWSCCLIRWLQDTLSQQSHHSMQVRSVSCSKWYGLPGAYLNSVYKIHDALTVSWHESEICRFLWMLPWILIINKLILEGICYSKRYNLWLSIRNSFAYSKCHCVQLIFVAVRSYT